MCAVREVVTARSHIRDGFGLLDYKIDVSATDQLRPNSRTASSEP